MTRDEILNMPAGREMDALVAEKVMGLCIHRNKIGSGMYYKCPDCGDNRLGRDTFVYHYSTDIAAAWEVVEKFAHNVELFNLGGPWHCEFGHDLTKEAEADTAPLAICRAALLTEVGK